MKGILGGFWRVAGVWLLVLAGACGPAAGAPAGVRGGEAGGAAGAASAPAGGAAPASAAPSGLQALVEGARKEGALSFVWGEGTVGGSDGVRRLAEGFNRYYGLNLDVRFTPGPSMAEMAPKVVQEYQAGRPASTDIVVGYANHMYTLMQGDALPAIDWASWATNVQDPRLVAPGGGAVTFQSSMQGITYNTQRVRPDEVPRSMEALLEPRYKGRVASTPYASGFDRLAIPERWGEQRTREYAARLADQVAGLIRCNEKERLLSGEFDIFALDCSHSDAFRMRAQGAPIDFVMASDAPFVLLLYMGIPKNAPHPNAARLWANYLLSREAQDFMYESDFSDTHLLEGSRTAPLIREREAAGSQILYVDVQFYQTHDEALLNKSLSEIQRILQKR
ncbi:MAG TPA: ABC transporter substrate-binding protein [Chloroflexota bacterium]|nr:ABC transporter substrate-binding protein [Chloroflexota bacterium]